MPKSLDEILEETLQLGLEDRARLAGKLILSLDEPAPAEAERLWLAEAERRLEAHRTGNTRGLPLEAVLERIASELS